MPAAVGPNCGLGHIKLASVSHSFSFLPHQSGTTVQNQRGGRRFLSLDLDVVVTGRLGFLLLFAVVRANRHKDK
jgi:hypothetical protein